MTKIKGKKIPELKKKWQNNSSYYKKREIGDGVQSFVKDLFLSGELFGFTEINISLPEEKRKLTFIHEKDTKEKRHADFVLYVDQNIVIPVEVEKYGNIEAGTEQLRTYQKDLLKAYGILTDGYNWRFYYGDDCVKSFTLETILNDKDFFLTYWREYIKPSDFYLNIFKSKPNIGLEIEQNKLPFFKDITALIRNFKNQLELEGYFNSFTQEEKRKKAVEITYAYLIQFILYKTLVDNAFDDFGKEWTTNMNNIHRALKTSNYKEILVTIANITEKISTNIYRPFSEEQKIIDEKFNKLFRQRNSVEDISPWLDIFVFIKKYSFANLQNEIFGYIYENYLKFLYEEKKLGQYFTDPEVVNFMLDAIGYDNKNLEKRLNNDPTGEYISIIDPACGSGTFLYSAADRIANVTNDNSLVRSKLVENLITSNIYGLDVAEFPLYLAEMNIIMRILPKIINEKFNNPLEKKIKLFLTEDSISEFIDSGIENDSKLIEQNHIETANVHSYIRDEENLSEMKKSMKPPRRRYDFVIGNPPYISYLECAKQGVPIFKRIKQKKNQLNSIYGVNLHSVPGNPKKFAPTPNLYAFFLALGLGLLKKDGKLCYIIPQTILVNTVLDVVRYKLAKFTTIEKIITFNGKLFIGRGLNQDKPISTSSLIIVLKKKLPLVNHKVKVFHYKGRYDDIKTCLEKIRLKKDTEYTEILQKKLLDNLNNWNFINLDKTSLDFFEHYADRNDDISTYYDHDKSEEIFKSDFFFDRGLKFPKNKIKDGEIKDHSYFIPLINKLNYVLDVDGKTIEDKYLDVPFGSQGELVFKQKYKIVWNYMNFDKFYFSDQKIMLPFNWVTVSSNNKKEILYLFSLLNSNVNKFFIDKLLRVENEDKLKILLGIKLIKDQIRIPVIDQVNIKIKGEIINIMEEMVHLEARCLADLIDFSDLRVQKFDEIYIQGKYLIMKKDHNVFKKKINKNYKRIKILIETKYNKLMSQLEFTLDNLKSLKVMDYSKRDQMKNYIDDLVFALYFGINIKKLGIEYAAKIKSACRDNKYYKILEKALTDQQLLQAKEALLSKKYGKQPIGVVKKELVGKS